MMAWTLNVYLKWALVGQLEQDHSGATRFRYDETWLASSSAVPLSHSLPLKRGRFGRNECRPFFAGLLPEEDSRKLIAETFGISDRNDFALLEKIGAECAGAVNLLRPDELPAATPPRYRKITREELAGKFAELPRRPLLAGEAGMRLSLAGAQGKLVVRIQDDEFALPLDGSPSSHILKPESPRFIGLVENEYFCLRLGAQAGLDVASGSRATAFTPPRATPPAGGGISDGRGGRRRIPSWTGGAGELSAIALDELGMMNVNRFTTNRFGG